MDLNKRQAQYLALQNQINPHSLYNTLESIRGEALIAGLDGVADMTEALAKFFRYTITKVENLVSVEEELDNCETYFGIQKYRFGDRLNYNLEIDPECAQIRIPKLTIVTFVENACVHGIESKASPGWIFVRVYKREEQLCIEIEDTGSGIEEQKLYQMQHDMQNADIEMLKNKKSVGMLNACLRLKMCTEDHVCFEIEGEEGVGTWITICIPMEYLSFAEGTGVQKGERNMLKVLLVDDEPFIIQGLKVLIDWEQEGYMIAGTASNGKEAYDFLKKESVDLIIADIQMPVMTGLDLQEAIRKENLSNAYFVILSGYADFEYARRALQNECTDYILKPVDPNEFKNTLNKVVNELEEAKASDELKNKSMEFLYEHALYMLLNGTDVTKLRQEYSGLSLDLGKALHLRICELS